MPGRCRSQQQSQHTAPLRRQLPATHGAHTDRAGAGFQAGGHHRGDGLALQHLAEGPVLIGRAAGLDDQQSSGVDPQAQGRGGAEVAPAIEHHQRAARATGLAGRDHRQGASAGGFTLGEPLDQRAPTKPALGQHLVEGPAAAGDHLRAFRPMDPFEPVDLAAEVFDQLGIGRMAGHGGEDLLRCLRCPRCRGAACSHALDRESGRGPPGVVYICILSLSIILSAAGVGGLSGNRAQRRNLLPVKELCLFPPQK